MRGNQNVFVHQPRNRLEVGSLNESFFISQHFCCQCANTNNGKVGAAAVYSNSSHVVRNIYTNTSIYRNDNDNNDSSKPKKRRYEWKINREFVVLAFFYSTVGFCEI